MNFPGLLFVLLLFCGLTSAQGDSNDPKTENHSPVQSCYPQMFNLLKEFGAMREKLEAVEAKMQESQTQILELKNKDQKKIAFSAGAGHSGHIGPVDIDTTLIFRKVITNVGNAYNQFTGIFTAPVAGIYYFMFFYHAGGSKPVALSLIKNNESVVWAYDHQSLHDGADNGGNAAFLQLQQGDHIYIRLSAKNRVWGDNDMTTFSGALISQT